MKTTPENITTLGPNQIFVFGSNTEGRHGKGAAKIALQKFGAKYGQAEGIQGQSYGIVTKELRPWMTPVGLEKIREGISTFFDFAASNGHLEFFLTKIGTALAGYTTIDIKKLVDEVVAEQGRPSNIVFPEEFL